jgi:hypothetical protein
VDISSLGDVSLKGLYLHNNLLDGPIPELSPSLVYCRVTSNAGLCAQEGISNECTAGLEICPVYPSITTFLSSALTSVIEPAVDNSSSSNYAISKTFVITPPTTITSTKEMISTREPTLSLTLDVDESRTETTSAEYSITFPATVEETSTEEIISTSGITTSRTIGVTSTISFDLSTTSLATLEETSTDKMISTSAITTPRTVGESSTELSSKSTASYDLNKTSPTSVEETSTEEVISSSEMTTSQTAGETYLSIASTTSFDLRTTPSATVEEISTDKMISTSEMKTAEPSTTKEFVETTTAWSTTPKYFTYTSHDSTTSISMPTQGAIVQSNVPGVTLESITGLNKDIPEGCFKGIGDLCQSNAVNVTSCSNSTVSDHLVEQALNRASSSLGATFPTKEADSVTSVTHTSTCEGNQQIDWVETYELTSTDSREPNTTYDVTVVLLKQEFTAVSFLQVGINSFGTSSVQIACYFVNGEAVEFSGVPGGIVGGYSVSKDVYDCSYYLKNEVQSKNEGDVTSELFTLVESEFPDLPDDVGLALEYLIVCIYILVALYGAYRSYSVHQQQRTRSDYKTNVNIGFIVLFSSWAFGNLLYMVLYSLALTESNFFYIKQVLTLTYFVVYFGFVLIIQYRYEFLVLT